MTTLHACVRAIEEFTANAGAEPKRLVLPKAAYDQLAEEFKHTGSWGGIIKIMGICVSCDPALSDGLTRIE